MNIKVAAVVSGLLLAFSCTAQNGREIDTANSKLTVFAFKTGLFSFAAHDHEINAPITAGRIDDSGKSPRVTFRVNAREMNVLDPKASEKDRAEIQRDMQAKVLESEQYPTIEFTSTTITQTSPDHWTVVGDLTLHGKTRPITVAVEESNGKYTGSTKLKQTDFGITPIAVAGGTVKVKDELKIEFAIKTK